MVYLISYSNREEKNFKDIKKISYTIEKQNLKNIGKTECVSWQDAGAGTYKRYLIKYSKNGKFEEIFLL